MLILKGILELAFFVFVGTLIGFLCLDIRRKEELKIFNSCMLAILLIVPALVIWDTLTGSKTILTILVANVYLGRPFGITNPRLDGILLMAGLSGGVLASLYWDCVSRFLVEVYQNLRMRMYLLLSYL
jgi:hypothetical protein